MEMMVEPKGVVLNEHCPKVVMVPSDPVPNVAKNVFPGVAVLGDLAPVE